MCDNWRNQCADLHVGNRWFVIFVSVIISLHNTHLFLFKKVICWKVVPILLKGNYIKLHRANHVPRFLTLGEGEEDSVAGDLGARIKLGEGKGGSNF